MNSEWIEHLILGLIQGITEFLPISSTGHLVLIRNFFGINPESNSAILTILHLGTLSSLLVVEGKNLTKMILSKHPFRNIEFHAIFITTLATLIFYLSFQNLFESSFQDAGSVAIGLVFTAFILVYAELRKSKSFKNLRHTTFLDWIAIGFLQAVAIIPGVSRSGATIAGGLLIGMNRYDSVKFSFMLSIPVILGATLIKLENIESYITANPGPAILGFLTAFTFGIWAMKFMLNYVKKNKLEPFAIYCLILGFLSILVVSR
ncbi:undecaprenyl-diphosphatase [bacterium]|nr:undecaprenyl-diphosphatase [bacterium]